jgi:hypothetical protein
MGFMYVYRAHSGVRCSAARLPREVRSGFGVPALLLRPDWGGRWLVACAPASTSGNPPPRHCVGLWFARLRLGAPARMPLGKVSHNLPNQF